MKESLGYGPCISDEEYDRLVVELHSHLPDMPGKEEDRKVRKKALNLAIDHRLGIDFPKEKRDRLWEIAEHVEGKRLKLAAKYFFGGLFRRSTIDPKLAKDANLLTGFMVEAYSEVLDERETRRFFGLDEGEEPSLPVDQP